MNRDTANVWNDIELGMNTDSFFTSCQISSMKKKLASNPLKPRSPFKWVFMDIIPVTESKGLTSETNFSCYLLIFDA